MAQMGIYFDQSRCTGCFTCVIACKDWYDTPAYTPGRMRVSCIEHGTFPDLFAAYLALSCGHCQNPPCMAACPESAISKDPSTGIVTVDPNKCVGNTRCPEKCRKACPWDVPQFAPEAGARMDKCDLCADRIKHGQQAICVEACPMHAIDIGPLDELYQKYGDQKEAEGFVYKKRFAPAVVFKPRFYKIDGGNP